ncbi:MAG: hypothetical protein J6N78_04115, partial [Clostridia bacterium]|nr:hypothetical protein [Clostridia bacterium]
TNFGICQRKERKMLENRMVLDDDYIENDSNYEDYLEYLAEKDDQDYDDKWLEEKEREEL